MRPKTLFLLAALWFSFHHQAPAQTLTLTAADAKAVKHPKNVLGIQFTNCYLQDGTASHGLTGSVARVRDKKTGQVTASLLTLGNAGLDDPGPETLYALALTLPATLTKSLYVLKEASANGLSVVLKGTTTEVEYVAQLVLVRLTRCDGKAVSGEISGTFVLAGKAAKGQPAQVVLKKVVFTDCELM